MKAAEALVVLRTRHGSRCRPVGATLRSSVKTFVLCASLRYARALRQAQGRLFGTVEKHIRRLSSLCHDSAGCGKALISTWYPNSLSSRIILLMRALTAFALGRFPYSM